ncbi:MAG: hypothetical protein A2V70_03975 [Planctomycetes bacterium RBG_13_63_9]|nr:MAG: hypothetical protein A2V70_03975 [Planctomycetes bacterium RBG_13_63_9]
MNKFDPLHVVFAGGGTAGHLFPGLAVAEQLACRLPQVRITFVGSGKAFERRHVAASAFEYLAVPCRPLPRNAGQAISFIVHNLAGYLAAGRFLKEEQVDVVVGLGGYASVPAARAAKRRGVPLVLLEQNAVPGRATRWLARGAAFARGAQLVCAAMAETRSALRCRCPVHVTGNPIRDAFQLHLSRHRRCEKAFSPISRSTAHRLVVLGGSGGAQSLNESVPRALYKTRRRLTGWQIIHQSGEAGLERTRELYRKLDLRATVAAFIDGLPRLLTATDLAVCRAGGTTLAELAAAGVPAVLLPYPHAADDHQRRNAKVYADAGGAVALDGRELSGRLDDHLADVLSELLDDPGRRAGMVAAMGRLARPRAASDVAERIIEVVGHSAEQSAPRAA